MSSASYETKPGVVYTMINGVPCELVIGQEPIDGGIIMTMQYVPAKKIEDDQTSNNNVKGEVICQNT